MDNDVKDRLQYQLNVERMNAQKYFYIASVMSNLAYDGFAHFFTKQGQGELEHANKIVEFLVSKRIQPEYRALMGVNLPFSVIELAKEAYRTELTTTTDISTLYQLAEDNGEPQVCAFLVGLLVEQVEEETWASDLVDLVVRADDNGLILLDEIYGKK